MRARGRNDVGQLVELKVTGLAYVVAVVGDLSDHRKQVLNLPIGDGASIDAESPLGCWVQAVQQGGNANEEVDTLEGEHLQSDEEGAYRQFARSAALLGCCFEQFLHRDSRATLIDKGLGITNELAQSLSVMKHLEHLSVAGSSPH